MHRSAEKIFFRSASSLLFIGILLSSAIGCGWGFLTEHSVRFSGYSEGDFTRLPELAINPAMQKKGSISKDDESRYESADKSMTKLDALWDSASKAETEGNYKLTVDYLQNYLERSSAEFESGYFYTYKLQLRRNSARDRLDALQSLSRGVKPPAITAYLQTRANFDGDFGDLQGDAVTANTYAIYGALAEIKAPASLVDNVDYLRGATLFRERRYKEAEMAFRTLLQKYPRSEKREAAYLMAERAAIQVYKEALQSADNEIDQSRKRARESAMQLYRDGLREFPRGEYAIDLRGWVAYLDSMEGNYAAAMAKYYRSLSVATNPLDRQSLLISLRLTRHKITADDLRKVEEDLLDEPVPALTYAYHVLYNYLPNVEFYEDYDSDRYSNEENEEAREAAREKEGRQEKEQIVAFIHRLLRRHPGSAMSGGFLLRLSQAQMELNDAAAARASVVRALGTGLKSRDRLDALWIKGASEFRLQQHAAARRTLQQLIAEDPSGELAEGAGRLIAMAAEDMGDLDGALEQYIRLDYKEDIAYFADVLLTPEQLAGFLARHPASPKANELQYALAVRYLRLHRWNEARAALAKVKVTQRGEPDWYDSSDADEDPVEFRTSRNTAKTPSDTPGVASRWIWRDQKTIDDLERMEREIAAATDDEAKAEAMYQMASYLYQGSSLLFYNPAFWEGSRHYKLDELEYTDGFRAPGEAQIFNAHMREHEPVVHALNIYLDLINRFPKTRAARDAMYTAAVCHERLSDYNSYWRNVYGYGMHAGARMVDYRDVRSAYTSYRIPRGTIGWEPVTRTVNGGAAWDTLPKSAPKPRRRDLLRSYVQSALAVWREKTDSLRQQSDAAATWINTTVDSIIRGLLYSLLAILVLGTCYFTSLGLYLYNQESPPLSLSLETPKNYPDNPVEKLISEDSSDSQ